MALARLLPDLRHVTDEDGVVLPISSTRVTAGWQPRGGSGGRGNSRFPSNNRRAPAFAE